MPSVARHARAAAWAPYAALTIACASPAGGRIEAAGHAPESSATPDTTRSMSDVNGAPSAAPAGHAGGPGTSTSTLGAYLRRVADALAAPTAAPDAVLAAAGARDVSRGRDFDNFRTPDPRLAGSIELRVGAGMSAEATSVTFDWQPAADRVSLGEVAAAFGAWRRDPPIGGQAWPVAFTRDYRPAPSVSGTGASVTASAVLFENPSSSNPRVRSILLVRNTEGEH